MAADVDIEALGLLDGLEGDARQERAELIAWLLDRGFDLDHIRGSVAAPLVLAATRVFGDDGDYVSAREICSDTASCGRRRLSTTSSYTTSGRRSATRS